MKANGLKFGNQRGFSMIEMVIVIVVMLVMLGIAMNWVMGMAKDARNAQQSDQLAKELSLIGKASKAYLLTAPAATYPLNTSVNIPITTLITGGFLPTDFAARAGTGTAAISPFGQPYMVVARRIVAGEPPTVVVSEASTPLPVKLADVGVEDSDAAILAFKQKVAAQTGRDYKAISATIAKSSRTATGVGNAFTKDLTAYFAAGFTQASAVALVNFKDLDPDDGGEGGNPIADAPKYSNCQVVQGQLISGLTQFMNVCSATSGPGGTDGGRRIVGDRDMSVCGNNGQITVLPFGGTLTSGLDESNLGYAQFDLGYCPGDYDSVLNRCRQPVGRTYGIVTMNSVQVASKQCSRFYYQVVGGVGVYREDKSQVADYNVCCKVDPLPSP